MTTIVLPMAQSYVAIRHDDALMTSPYSGGFELVGNIKLDGVHRTPQTAPLDVIEVVVDVVVV